MISSISDKEKQILSKYLTDRLSQRSLKTGLSIVYDITYYCNLSCRGCAVNAKRHVSHYINQENLELKKQEIFRVLEKIRDHVAAKNIKPFFLNFGGGEPFLREDMKEILKYSSELFGKESIAVDTNGTFAKVKDIKEIANYVSCIGISLDGLEEYHNWWRRSKNVINPYKTTLEFIKQAIVYPEIKKVLEVSSVITKKNIGQLLNLINILEDIEVKYYSVHRAFPVGRMALLNEILPDELDYLKIALLIAQANEKNKIKCHFHHTIESIYASILLSKNTYVADKVCGNPDSRSSFGIDPNANIYFDPWCMVKPWNQLTGGNILDDNFDFDWFTSGKGMGMLNIAKKYSLKENRCEGCKIMCSGGSRIAASAQYLDKMQKYTLSDLLIGLSKKDPACPNEVYINENK